MEYIRSYIKAMSLCALDHDPKMRRSIEMSIAWIPQQVRHMHGLHNHLQGTKSQKIDYVQGNDHILFHLYCVCFGFISHCAIKSI